MQPHIIVLLVVGCLTSGALGAFIHANVRSFRVNRSIEALIAQLRGHIDSLSEILTAKNTELERLAAEAADQHRRRVETVEAIAVIERARDQWKDMYWKAGLGHSAAQELLMSRIHQLHSLLTKCGIKIPRNFEQCEEAVKKFRAEHDPEKLRLIGTGSQAANTRPDSVESQKC